MESEGPQLNRSSRRHDAAPGPRRADYVDDLRSRFAEYRAHVFGARDSIFDPVRTTVFLDRTLNVIARRDASASERKKLGDLVTSAHRWSGSMFSSQALAQSVFGNLIVLGRLDVRCGLQADDGSIAFWREPPAREACRLEYPVPRSLLGEPRPTSVDFFVTRPQQVAVECKLSEAEIGTCSRPRLRNEHRGYCDGSYTQQGKRNERCALSEIGVRYWRHVPELFPEWRAAQDHAVGPIRLSYQLVRNLLVVAVGDDGRIHLDNGHVLLLYDARKPSFMPDGQAMKTYAATREALSEPGLLRSCTWQRVSDRRREAVNLDWLTSQLERKYGF